MEITTPISAGELLDKITILKIKSDKLTDAEKLKNVQTELTALNAVAANAFEFDAPLSKLVDQLQNINGKLWVIEDDIRDCERAGDFGAEFVRLARAVYVTNDVRAQLKKDINLLLGSALVEEKSYQKY
jgi:hypothetical protein